MEVEWIWRHVRFVAGIENDDVGCKLLGGIKNIYIDSLACVRIPSSITCRLQPVPEYLYYTDL